MLTPKITAYDTRVIPLMYKEGWKLITIYEWLMFWEREEKKKRIGANTIPLDDFESFYKKYPNKKGRKDAEMMWKRLTEQERILAMEWLTRYIIYWKKTNKEKQHLPHPATWINWRRWEDDLSDTVFTPKNPDIERTREEDEEEKKNQEEKEALDKKIAYYQKDPIKWKEIEQQALRELSKSQRQSTMVEVLKKIKIRMIISNKP